MCAIFVVPIHCTDSVKLLNAKHLFMIYNLMKMIIWTRDSSLEYVVVQYLQDIDHGLFHPMSSLASGV